MLTAEILNLRKLNYLNLCKYLKMKYGPVPSSFFKDESCKEYNLDIRREDEGLFIHHIKKCEYKSLDKKEIAILHPFSYQEKDNLVYCNLIEMLILHFDIAKEYLSTESVNKTKNIVGLHGYINVICPIINDYFSGYVYKEQRYQKACELIKDNLLDYFDINYEFGRFVRIRDIIHTIPNLYNDGLKNPECYEASCLTNVYQKEDLEIPERYLQNKKLLHEFNSWRMKTYLPKYIFRDKNISIKEIYDKYNKYALEYIDTPYEKIASCVDIDHKTGFFKYIGPSLMPDDVRLSVDLMLYYMLGDNICWFTEWGKF